MILIIIILAIGVIHSIVFELRFHSSRIMSTEGGNPTQTQPLRAVNGSRKHRGHSKGRQGAGNVPGPAKAVTVDAVPPTEPEDGTVCWICAEPVKFYSVSECNHRTCHVCALRLRALYKRMDCTFCKVHMVTRGTQENAHL